MSRKVYATLTFLTTSEIVPSEKLWDYSVRSAQSFHTNDRYHAPFLF